LDTSTFVTLLNVTALVAIMLSMGMQVKFQAVTASVRPVHRVALGLLANYVLVPAVTVGLLILFQAAPLVSAGFLILAVCPGAPISPPATTIAKGNVAWAIGMMVILAGLSALLSPALLSILLSRIAPESDLHIDFLAIVRTLLVAQMLPLAAGLAIHHWLPQLAQKIGKPLGMVANLLLLVLVGLILATQFETLAAIRLRGWTGMGLLFFASLGIGWLCGGKDVAIRKALAVTTAARNAAVGLVIVNSNFADTPAVTAVVAYGLVSILGTFACALLLGKIIKVRSASE
jgi:bile acid:Na+ symporter, BASS family